MIDEVNRHRADHILTIEDPIEFVHRHKRCIVNQREIGVDATSFAEGLRAALRQDPDVILVGEMRDLETIGTALTAAETGHLVLCTLHTQSAAGTIDRIIDVFPAEQQEQVRIMLAGSLQGVITQALLQPPTARAAPPRSRSCSPTMPSGTSSARARSSRSTRSCRPPRAAGWSRWSSRSRSSVMRGVITKDVALGASSRAEQLLGLLDRAGFKDPFPTLDLSIPPLAALRVAGN